jgi:prepilin-type N-terminal cleavage/methylation domain-containing protein
MRLRRAPRGFTLTELLVVIAIVGVLVSMATVSMRPQIKAIDVANRVGDLVREANRRAVALGPVRAAVALNIGTKARMRVRGISAGPRPTFVLERLQEDRRMERRTRWARQGNPEKARGSGQRRSQGED